VLSADGSNNVGVIAKKYAGFIREAFTTADNFSITCKSIFLHLTFQFNSIRSNLLLYVQQFQLIYLLKQKQLLLEHYF
jgi:hypothetical protein